QLYEKRPDPRIETLDAGRSINLALSVRGLHALAAVGLHEEILSRALPMRGRMIHSQKGDLSFQPYGKDESESINSVSRSELNIALLDALVKYPDVETKFNHKCIDADLDTASAVFIKHETMEQVAVEADVLIGADGAFSAVRNAMLRLDRFDYSQDFLEHGYKELTIPAGPGGTHRIRNNALHIWPRGHFMLIALPNFDGSFTATCFWPFDGENSFSQIKNSTQLLRFFNETFPDVVPHMPELGKDFFANPTGSLVTVRCKPHHYSDKVILIGDAAHAVVPFYGQGMNASFEDCFALNRCLDDIKDNIELAFREYSDTRIENTNAIADLALENFIEMRDHTSSSAFIMKKKLEQTARRLTGGKFLPLYTMVTFTNIPYAEAVRRAKRQDGIVRNFLIGVIVFVIAALLIIIATILAR
ncbi:MAG TPA: NAD(P)/FAD-dependent oxidoreductase, partial [Acidobacteriota bacterium]|nr:NAD(P)/FAD-dependent oxidoreductase [Acidobacteriota bacterium]